MIPNVSSLGDDEEHFCKAILYKEIRNSRVRIWDVAILVPNLFFLLFIAVRFNRARLKLRATSSPIFLAFYGLVICNVVISVIRCVVSMTVNAAATVGGKADKVLWVTVRFFLLSTEMSVVIFGLAFGHLDSRSSIRRVLLATSLIALAYTITQGTLELVLPDDTFHVPSKDFYVFGHGGMMFWFCSSLVFTMIYVFILILPWTRLRDRVTLPTRKSFYIYAGTLATLDLVQSIGAGFLNYTQNPVGLCIVDFTAAVYLTLFTPLVYHTFLSEFFGVSQPSIMFSYKAQVDDAMDEDTVSLPHQQSFSSLKTDSDYIYQVHTPSIHMPLYDSQSTKPALSPEQSFLSPLSMQRDWKNISQGSLPHGEPRSRSFTQHLMSPENSLDYRSFPATKSENFLDTQSADLKFFRSGSSSPAYGTPGTFSTTSKVDLERGSPRVSEMTPLKTTLHSILDNKAKCTRDPDGFESATEDALSMSSGQAVAGSARQKNWPELNEPEGGRPNAGGLGDYLMALTVPNLKKPDDVPTGHSDKSSERSTNVAEDAGRVESV